MNPTRTFAIPTPDVQATSHGPEVGSPPLLADIIAQVTAGYPRSRGSLEPVLDQVLAFETKHDCRLDDATLATLVRQVMQTAPATDPRAPVESRNALHGTMYLPDPRTPGTAKGVSSERLLVESVEFRELLAWVVRDVGEPQKTWHYNRLVEHLVEMVKREALAGRAFGLEEAARLWDSNRRQTWISRAIRELKNVPPGAVPTNEKV
jgi:hypothetical protein